MKTEISHLPEEKQNELKLITDLVHSVFPVDMIILFGSYARGDWVEDKYIEDGIIYEYKSDYDLLFVIEKDSKAQCDKLAMRMNKRIKDELHLNTLCSVIFHGFDYLSEEIKNGSYFFSDIYKEGIVLYTNGKFQLPKPQKLSNKARINKAQMYFDKWFENANDFLITYEFDFGRDKYNKAAFELHQSVERYFNTIILVYTDYKPKTHDLQMLYDRVCDLEADCKKIFTCNTEEEKRAFDLLKKAYIDSRYKIGYKISKDELVYLSERVSLLKDLCEKFCLEKIESFEDNVD